MVYGGSSPSRRTNIIYPNLVYTTPIDTLTKKVGYKGSFRRTVFVWGLIVFNLLIIGNILLKAKALYSEEQIGVYVPLISEIQEQYNPPENLDPVSTTTPPKKQNPKTSTVSSTSSPTVATPHPITPPATPPTIIYDTPPPPIVSPVLSGEATLVVSSVPLLSGGVVKAGKSVPVSYLQIINTGGNTATLTGFTVRQNGSASVQSVIGFTTIDDKGGSQSSTGGVEGSTPFKDGVAFVPTQVIFAPGQMKLFTIRAVLSSNISSYVGTDLKINVASITTTAKIEGVFPITGTTWTIAN